MRFTVAIQAGGNSRRMGTDKAFVPLSGRPMIEHVIERIQGIGQDATFIVTNAPERYRALGLPLVADVIPGTGPLGGIYSALTYSTAPYTLIVGCDMPLVNPNVLRHLLACGRETTGPYDVIVPRNGGVPQVLHALYAATCQKVIQQQLAERQLQIKAFLDQVNTRFVDELEYAHLDPSGLSFRNVNTPQDLLNTEELLASG